MKERSNVGNSPADTSGVTSAHISAVRLPRVAVVDDDASFLRSVGRLLRSAGYPVEIFSSGQQFLASLPASTPECLVVDVHMPEMTGLELHEQLVAQGARFPVVFVTAYDTPQTAQYVRRTGSGLVLKPFNNRALLVAVNDAVNTYPPSPATPP